MAACRSTARCALCVGPQPPASTSQNSAQKSTGWLSSCFLELSLAVIFGRGWGQGNGVGWQMVLNRKGGSVCLQTRRGVVPLLPGALDKISVGASCQPRDAARQMNRRQPGAAPAPERPVRERSRGGRRRGCAASTGAPRSSRLARGLAASLQPACISRCLFRLFLPVAVPGDLQGSAGICRHREALRDALSPGVSPASFPGQGTVTSSHSPSGWHGEGQDKSAGTAGPFQPSCACMGTSRSLSIPLWSLCALYTSVWLLTAPTGHGGTRRSLVCSGMSALPWSRVCWWWVGDGVRDFSGSHPTRQGFESLVPVWAAQGLGSALLSLL